MRSSAHSVAACLILSAGVTYGGPISISIISASTSATVVASGSGVNCTVTDPTFVYATCNSPTDPTAIAFGSATAGFGSLMVSGSLGFPFPVTPLQETATASFTETVLITGATGTGYLAVVVFPIATAEFGNISFSINGQSFGGPFTTYPSVALTGVGQFSFGTPFEFTMSVSETQDSAPTFRPYSGSVTVTQPNLLAYQVFDFSPSYCGPPRPGEPPRTPFDAPCSDTPPPLQGSLFAPEPATSSLILASAILAIIRRRRLLPNTSSDPDAIAL